MLKLIGTRLLLVVPQLLIVSALVFLMVYLVPGSPAASILGEAGSNPESIARVEAELGLDRPFFVRLGEWFAAALTGDLGNSLVNGRPVADQVLQRLPATLSLVGGGLLVAMLIGISLGVLAGTHARTAIDRGVTAFSSFMQAIPEFWLGLLLIIVFVNGLGIAPVVAWVPPDQNLPAWFGGLILPCLALGAGASALIARQTRTAVAAALSSPYTDTLIAAGVSRKRIIWVYALKNAMVPVLASSALAVSILIGTSLVMEKVFGFPGIGTLLINSVAGKDFSVVQGAVLFVAILIIIVNLVVDILYGVINPKVRPQ